MIRHVDFDQLAAAAERQAIVHDRFELTSLTVEAVLLFGRELPAFGKPRGILAALITKADVGRLKKFIQFFSVVGETVAQALIMLL